MINKLAKWDEKYSIGQYLFGTEPNTYLAERYAEIPMGEVLCLGDGEGRNSVFLAKQGYKVTAVDISLVGLNKAKDLAQKNKVEMEFIQADLAEFDIGRNKWQGIVSIFCHLPPSLRKQVHKGCLDGLKNGGAVLLEAYTPAQLEKGTGGPANIDMLMHASLLQKEFDGLNFLHLAELERDVQEGQGHSGLSSVVQMVGLK